MEMMRIEHGLVENDIEEGKKILRESKEVWRGIHLYTF